MTTKAERVVQAVRKYGPITCHDLAPIVDVSPDEISSMAREFIRNKKYGLFIAGKIAVHQGMARKIIAVNEIEYANYIAVRAERKPPPPVRKHPLPEERSFPRPVTQFHTCWQPSSPYYQAAA